MSPRRVTLVAADATRALGRAVPLNSYAVCARTSLGKEDGDVDASPQSQKPSERDLAGDQSRPAKAGHQPEASLAWAALQGHLRQRGRRPCDRASKVRISPRSFSYGKGATASARRKGLACWLGRGQRARHKSTGDPPGTWEALSSPPKTITGEDSGRPKIQARGRGRPQTAGAKARTYRRYHPPKATEPDGRGGRESESLVVPVKPGNRPDGTRWREGAPGHGIVEGNDVEITESRERMRENPHLRICGGVPGEHARPGLSRLGVAFAGNDKLTVAEMQ